MFGPPHFAKSSNGMELQYYWRQHQGCPEFSLEVTNAFVAMVSNSSGEEDGEGLEFWIVLFWFGDRSHGQGSWHGRGSWS